MLKDKEAEWAKMSEAERARRAKRMFVEERILTLACPRCGQAFVDFVGCFALTCSRDKAAFCAYCLEDCGADAHRHVANCPHNIAPGKALFATPRDLRGSAAAASRPHAQGVPRAAGCGRQGGGSG